MLQASLFRATALVYSFVLQSSYLFGPTKHSNLKDVKDAFDRANITKDAHLTFEPITFLEVTFPQTKSAPVQVSIGDHLGQNQTSIPPLYGLHDTQSLGGAQKYVVAIIDLDPPTPQEPKNAQFRHFLGGNFEAVHKNDIAGVVLLANTTPALTEFQQPSPPSGSDPHCYVFLLYQQSEEFNKQTEVNPTTPKQNFNISQFALNTDLGDPLGGTYILVGPESES